jgi:phosphoglycerate kinase
VVGITRFIQAKAAGFLVEKELKYLDKIVRSPEKPFCAILGGAKVSDKIPVIKNLIGKADDILIGGAMAYTFFAARGLGTGRSLVERELTNTALSLLKEAEHMNFELPRDHVIAEAMDEDAPAEVVDTFPLPEDRMALDIGPATIRAYGEVIAGARTIFWNGPMGVFEIDRFAKGTEEIAEAVASSPALSIVGGGDSAAALRKAGLQDRISHISTGGGASLEYVANETLPGIEALSE